MAPTILLDGNSLTLPDLTRAANHEAQFLLAPAARGRMLRSRDVVEQTIAEGRTTYGVTTGFGVFSEVPIPPQDVRKLQRNLIDSHCAGMGDPYPPEAVRAMMVLRANALAKGFSGIRPEVVDLLLEMFNRDVIPVIPSQGSVGASGDLAPLAHLAGALMGRGEVIHEGRRIAAEEGLKAIGASPVAYEAKEGLAMINGTQAICGVGGLALDRALMLSELADATGALSLDALRGTDAAFDVRIQAARPHPGQTEVAARMLRLLRGSELRESHRDCAKVQDAYSLRCIPQVHGAVRDALRFAATIMHTEINSATDNPLIFAAEGDVVSGGNFHGAPVALACDVAAIALTDLASISERRIERLVNPDLSDLPPFLVAEGGLNSGFMIAQVAAAALVSECKALSHPASVDSIPTSANKEDHVSMGPIAAWKLSRIVENLAGVLAVEAMCGAQAVELLRPLRSSPALEAMIAEIRKEVAPWNADRYLHADLEAMKRMLPRLHGATYDR